MMIEVLKEKCNPSTFANLLFNEASYKELLNKSFPKYHVKSPNYEIKLTNSLEYEKSYSDIKHNFELFKIYFKKTVEMI